MTERRLGATTLLNPIERIRRQYTDGDRTISPDAPLLVGLPLWVGFNDATTVLFVPPSPHHDPRSVKAFGYLQTSSKGRFSAGTRDIPHYNLPIQRYIAAGDAFDVDRIATCDVQRDEETQGILVVPSQELDVRVSILHHDQRGRIVVPNTGYTLTVSDFRQAFPFYKLP